MTSGSPRSGTAARQPDVRSGAAPLPGLIGQLWCLHWPTAQTQVQAPAPVPGWVADQGVILETCLRRLAYGLGPPPPTSPETGPPAPGELLRGPDAYRLLLEVASGLRSHLPGETNVLGQFRRAWEHAANRLDPEHRQRLRPVVDALLADTQRLRAAHLQGVGGNSYGSLVRALLDPPRDARILFVGTGELARSMLPLFRGHEVGVWNHRPAPPLAGVSRWFAPQAADDAAAWASALVFTTPRDARHDAAWRTRLAIHGARRVVHLGLRRQDGWTWPGNTVSFNLDDVFALASARDHHRTLQLERARAASTGLVAARLDGGRPVTTTPGSAACLAG